MSLFLDYINNKIDEQTIFNHVYHQILLQNAPAISPSKDCAIFNPETGCKCAIGHLLPDNLLESLLMKYGSFSIGVSTLYYFHGLGRNVGFKFDNTETKQQGFLEALRIAHDRAAQTVNAFNLDMFIQFFKENMEEIAKKYNLIVPSE